MLEPFQLPFVQRGLIEVLILAIPAGILGTWIVLRGLAFFSHAVGTAAFPGLVLADGLGFAAPLGAFGAATAFAAGKWLGGGPRAAASTRVVAMVLVACLAAGVILASDVFGSGANIETLLFGSLLLVDDGDIALAAAAAAATVAATVAQKPFVLFLGAEAHNALDAGAVVPTAVEDDDFAGGREVLHVTLHVHLRLLAVGRRRQGDEPEDARADALGDGLDGAALAGRVAPLEDDHHAQALELDPLLQVAEFGLELAQLLFVLLGFHLGFGFVDFGFFMAFSLSRCLVGLFISIVRLQPRLFSNSGIYSPIYPV